MSKKHTVTVVGSGYVGTTTAALLSASNIKTFAVDIDPRKVDKLNAGKAPFFEEGLDALVANGIKTGNLIATQSYEESVSSSNIVMSSVGTPDNPDGSPNLDYVFMALESIAKSGMGPIIYVQKSTVPVGTGRKIIARFKELSDREFTYVSSPEFLREGTAVIDSIEPDRIVVGGDKTAANLIADLFLNIYNNRQKIGEVARVELLGRQTPNVHYLNIESAELTKVSANAFLALKISFANSIAKLADKTDADITEVMDAIGADNRIGRAFLNAGRGYGGGCFPKDVKGLISSAKDFGVDMSIMTAASDTNDSMPSYVVDKIEQTTEGLKGLRVAVLGLAFKAGTSDTRKSPGIKIANILADRGAEVCAYDPEGVEEAVESLDSEVSLSDSAENCTSTAQVVVVATEWPELKIFDYGSVDAEIIMDAMNMLDMDELESQGKTYLGIGR